MTSSEVQKYLAEKMGQAPMGQRRETADSLAREFTRHRDWVYRNAKKGGWRPIDHWSHQYPEPVAPETIDYINQLRLFSKRKGRRCTMPVRRAMEIARDNGIHIPVGVRRMQQIIKARGLSRRQIKEAFDHPSFIPMASLYPNHVHQFDMTNCLQYFLDDDGLKVRDISIDYYPTKPDSFKRIKRRLIRFVYIDHLTGAFYVQYRYTSGEKAADILRFWWEAWSDKSQVISRLCGEGPHAPDPSLYPFRGVPEILYLDNSAAHNSHYAKGFAESLGVEIVTHKPDNPQAKGTVEGFMNIWEQDFESGLKVKPAISLDQLNFWALDRCIYYNASMEHSRHRSTRMGLWSFAVRPENLRVPPSWEVTRKLARSKPFYRKIDRDLAFSFDHRTYRVSGPDLAGVPRAEIRFNPWEYPEKLEVHYRKKVYEAALVAKNQYGFPAHAVQWGKHRRRHRSPTERAIDELQKKPMPELREGAVFGQHSQKLGNIGFVSKAAEMIEVPSDRVDTYIPRMDAIFRVRDQLGRSLTTEENQRLKEILPDPCLESDIPKAIEQLTAPASAEGEVAV